MLLISIDGYIYDVCNFDHPGEGIRDCYLNRYRNKEVSDEFFRYHMTDEPDIILEQARELGMYEGVRYVCRNYFKNRIPKCFYYNRENNYDNLVEEGHFFITPLNNKTTDGYTFHIMLEKYEKIDIHKYNNKWKTFWQNDLLLFDYVEDFIKYLVNKNIVKLIFKN